ncbi:MAG TPA: hypothetical protein VF324_09160 [Methanobacterium sp.]
MSRLMKFILFLIFFAVFFEAGLISSYTIVTSQSPDVGKLIGMQIEEITSFLSFGSGSKILNPQTNLNITNYQDVASKLNNKTGLDINVQTLATQTTASTKQTVFPVNITAMGYQNLISGGNSSVIVITANQTYSITASANASLSNGEVIIDIDSIKITSSSILYGNTTSS